MNIIIFNSENSSGNSKSLISKLNEDNSYTEVEINSDLIENDILPEDVISYFLYKSSLENKTIINVDYDIVNKMTCEKSKFLEYVISSTFTAVLSFCENIDIKYDVFLSNSVFFVDIKNKLNEIEIEKIKNPFTSAVNLLGSNGFVLFNSDINNNLNIYPVSGSSGHPISRTDFINEIIKSKTEHNELYSDIMNNNAIMVREYSPLHAVITKILKKKNAKHK